MGEEGMPSQFGIGLAELREIMEYRGPEAHEKVAELGGTQEICRNLASSPINGNWPNSTLSLNFLNLKSKWISVCLLKAYLDQRQT